MKKIEKFAQKCYESYFHAKTGWFLGAVLSLTMLPRVLRALWMIQKQAELSDFQVGLSMVIGYAAAAICAYLAAVSKTATDKRNAVEGNPGFHLPQFNVANIPACLVWALWICLLEVTRNDLFDTKAIFLKFELTHESFLVAYLPRAAAGILYGIVFSVLLFCFLRRAEQSPELMQSPDEARSSGNTQSPEQSPEKLQSSGNAQIPGAIKPSAQNKKGVIPGIIKAYAQAVWKNRLSVLLFALFFFLCRVIYLVAVAGIVQNAGTNLSVMAWLTKVFLLACVIVLVLAPSFRKLTESAGEAEVQTQPAAQNGSSQSTVQTDVLQTAAVKSKSTLNPQKLIFLLVAGVVPVVFLCVLTFAGKGEKTPNSVYAVDGVMLYADSAAAREIFEDYMGAMRDLDKMDATAEAWLAYLDEDLETLTQLSEKMPDVDQIFILKLYQQANGKNKKNSDAVRDQLMDKLNENPDSTYWYHIYLELVPAKAGIAKYPKVSAAYYILAKLYGVYSYESMKYAPDVLNLKRAEELYLKCLEIDENQPVVWYTLSGLYDHIEEYEKCYQCCEKAIELTAYGPFGIHMGDAYYGYGVVPHALYQMGLLQMYKNVDAD